MITDNPAAFAAARLHDTLEAQGVRIDLAPHDGKAPEDARPLARVDSPTVARLVRTTLKCSSIQHSRCCSRQSRARGGEDATRGTAAYGRCHAKTGTRVTVSALSGYCSTRSGDTVVFSLLTNETDPIAAKRLEDRMTAAIARLG